MKTFSSALFLVIAPFVFAFAERVGLMVGFDINSLLCPLCPIVKSNPLCVSVSLALCAWLTYL